MYLGSDVMWCHSHYCRGVMTSLHAGNRADAVVSINGPPPASHAAMNPSSFELFFVHLCFPLNVFLLICCNTGYLVPMRAPGVKEKARSIFLAGWCHKMWLHQTMSCTRFYPSFLSEFWWFFTGAYLWYGIFVICPACVLLVVLVWLSVRYQFWFLSW